MTLVHYTATVKDDRLLELPEAAKELHLRPGQIVEVQVDNAPADKTNSRMPVAMSPAEFTADFSEEALGHIWNDPVEDDAWRHL